MFFRVHALALVLLSGTIILRVDSFPQFQPFIQRGNLSNALVFMTNPRNNDGLEDEDNCANQNNEEKREDSEKRMNKLGIRQTHRIRPKAVSPPLDETERHSRNENHFHYDHDETYSSSDTRNSPGILRKAVQPPSEELSEKPCRTFFDGEVDKELTFAAFQYIANIGSMEEFSRVTRAARVQKLELLMRSQKLLDETFTDEDGWQ
ncbi:predicted protein [Chaetoceros tenuissimus]|uniref:Uncharacterized protein n=1 Tax=Chaetoceros tenuissimus TaxID=426638 RepID=A0AAD3D047_9STRA|nr:predicted protein [Chaetoceros tenuissimus]